MNMTASLAAAVALAASAVAAPHVSAQGMRHHGAMAKHGGKRVAYDAKDRRYHSVAYAKAHGMHGAKM